MLRLRGLHRDSELSGQSPPQSRKRKRRPGQPKPKRKPGSKRKVAPRKPAPIPAKYKHLYIKKAGFANYHFNLQEQTRTLSRLAELGDFTNRSGRWTIGGKTSAGDPFQFTLAKAGIGLEWKGKAFYQSLEKGDPGDEPPGTGGLLYALHQWRLFLARRDKGFGQLFYLGSESLDGQGERVDVMVTELGNIRSRWYFDRARGALLGFDSQREEDVDECALRFSGARKHDGLNWPATIRVSSGGKQVAVFQLDQVTAEREVSK